MRGRTICPFDADQEEVRRNAMSYEVDSLRERSGRWRSSCLTLFLRTLDTELFGHFLLGNFYSKAAEQAKHPPSLLNATWQKSPTRFRYQYSDILRGTRSPTARNSSHFSGDSWKYKSPPEMSPSGCVSPSESAKILDISIEPVTEGISGEKSSNSPVFEDGAGGGGGLYEPA